MISVQDSPEQAESSQLRAYKFKLEEETIEAKPKTLPLPPFIFSANLVKLTPESVDL